jgi:hypothetical protein
MRDVFCLTFIFIASAGRFNTLCFSFAGAAMSCYCVTANCVHVNLF